MKKRLRLVDLFACVMMLVVTLCGCGGSDSTGTLTIPNTGVAASPGGSPSVVPPGGRNSLKGTVSAPTGVPVTVSLYVDKALVGRTSVQGGAYSFPSLADGSYKVVLTGTNLRTQSDQFNLRASKATANYQMSSLDQAPTGMEIAGSLAQATHLIRGFNGFRFAPLSAQATFDWNRRNNFQTVKSGKSKSASAAQVTAITVPGAQFLTVDRTGMVWVSVNDTINEFPAGTPTSTGVVQINTNGQIVGQVTTAPSTNSGGGVVGTDDSLDVGIYNPLVQNVSVLPQGTTNTSTQAVAGTNVSVNAIVSQKDPNSVTGQSRMIVAGNVQSAPQLAFLSPRGTLTAATLPSTIPTNFVVLGALADPLDNTIYLSGHVPTVNGPAHLFHLSADGTQLLEDIPLGAFLLFSQQNLARDSQGSLWMAARDHLVKVSGTVGNRTVANLPALHQNASPFGLAVGIATDTTGHVWSADQQNNNVTEFDLNGTALATFVTGFAPTTVAVDPNGNAWVSCRGQLNQTANAVVNEVVVNGPVPPNTTVQTLTLPDTSTLTERPAPDVSTFLRTFPQSTYSETYQTQPTVITQTGQTITSQTAQSSAVLVTGPTIISQSPMYDANGNVYNVNSTTGDLTTGQVGTFTTQFTPEGQGTVIGQYANGSHCDAAYTFTPDGSGKIVLRARYIEEISANVFTITATFNKDGSIDNFTVVSSNANTTVQGSLSAAGQFVADTFDNRNPNHSVAHVGNASGASVVGVLIELLSQALPPPTPSGHPIVTAFMKIHQPPTLDVNPYTPGTYPGYITLVPQTGIGGLITLNMAYGNVQVQGFQAIPDPQTGILESFGPPTPTSGGEDTTTGTSEGVPSNQGDTTAVDDSGTSQGGISAVGQTGTGLEKGGPIK